MGKGIFGGLFDFNRDGELDVIERALEFAAFNEMRKTTELEEAGLDVDELEWMNEYDRRNVLLEAGLDPDDYDF